METKICKYCKIKFSKLPKTSYKQWSRQFCCSRPCADLCKEAPWLKRYQIKKGQRLSIKTEFKKGQTLNEENINWKGDDASYFAKHIWANNHFGKPRFCEHCKCSNRKMYHWANISNKGYRDRNDWIRLCVPCHKKFDLNR